MRKAPRKRGRTALLVGGIVAATALVASAIAVGVIVMTGGTTAAAPDSPHPGMPLVVVSDTEAATAAGSTADADERRAAEYLASMPTAVWLTPEEYGIADIGGYVTNLLAEAKTADAALTVVIYGLPERDCGQFSAGGLAPADYKEWTAEIALALQADPDVTSIVILEPDALALAPECGNVEDRVRQLGSAIDDLLSENTWIYLDAGHSNWLPPDEMARLLHDAGVDRVRGFATNVSNYNTYAKESAYAHRLSGMLNGAHAVIDTSRSGAGSNGEWCNPSGRLTGEEGGTKGDDVVDVNLWIKPPGESDGECNGGPAAGTWWPQAAVELTRRAVG